MTDSRRLAEIKSIVTAYLEGLPEGTWESSVAETVQWVLGFLAGAGHLVPSGSEAKQQWCVYHNSDESAGRHNVDSLREAIWFRQQNFEEKDPLNPLIQVRTVISWPDGSRFLGPWKDVSE